MKNMVLSNVESIRTFCVFLLEYKVVEKAVIHVDDIRIAGAKSVSDARWTVLNDCFPTKN